MTDSERDLIARIQRAFHGVTLGGGISLNMTKYHDSGGSMKKYSERAKSDEREDWSRISDSTLEEFTVTFSFTDVKGFRFYLPAYMIWTIRNHRTSTSIIGDFTIYALTPDHYIFRDIGFINAFDDEQFDCITRFLAYCVENDGSCDGTVADDNLRKVRKAQPEHATDG